MNVNRLLRAIRVYTGKSAKDFANILGIANSSVTNIETKQLSISQYYGVYARQASIPTWLIEYLASEDDINSLQGNLKKVAEDILKTYDELYNPDSKIVLTRQHEARKIVTKMNGLLSQLEKLI